MRGWNTTTGAYSLSVRRVNGGAPPGPDPQPLPGTPIQVNAPPVPGTIAVAGERDLYRFVAPGLGRYIIETHGTTDTVLRLLGPNNTATLIGENDDAVPGQVVTSLIVRDLQSGTYYVEVSGYRTTTGPYTLTIRR